MCDWSNYYCSVYCPKVLVRHRKLNTAKRTSRNVDVDKLNSISYVARYQQYISPHNIIVSL